MKRISLLILILFISGCSLYKEENKISNTNNIKDEVENQKSDNSIKLGLFLRDGNYSYKEKLVDTYYTSFTSGEDIGHFEVFLTDENVISGTNFKDIWNKYYNNYEDIDNYKIGFNIKFILSDGTNYNANYLEPDIYKFSKYFYVYLYDDIQESGNNYLENINNDNLLTSIKIQAAEEIEKVENIILAVFIYESEEDFDSEGNYKGNSIYVIRIKKS